MPATELLEPNLDEVSDVAADTGDGQPEDVVAADLLVEEISIDGMCGVY